MGFRLSEVGPALWRKNVSGWAPSPASSELEKSRPREKPHMHTLQTKDNILLSRGESGHTLMAGWD